MKRILATFLSLVLFFVAVEKGQADNPVETYPVLRADGNVYSVGRWADGQYTVAAREYPELRPDGTQVYVWLWTTGTYSIQLREYSEVRGDGSLWAVSQWEDGSYTAIRKAASSPAFETPPPLPPQAAFTGSVGGVVQNCGLTEIRGVVRDAAGNPINGQRVRVTWPSGETTSLATGEEGREPGDYDVVLDSEAKDGLWRVWMIDGDGRTASDQLTVRSTKDCVSAQAANTIVVNFRLTPSFTGSVGGVNQNCGLTEIRGAIRDAAGNPINGQRVRVTWPTGETTGIATGEEGRDPGDYDVVLDNKAKDGIWHVWMVDGEGRAISDELTVRSTKDCVGAEAANTIVINFRPSARGAA